MRDDPARRLRAAGAMLAALFMIGTAGYCLIENFSLLEGMYMTVITLSSVGFGEVHQLTGWGKGFTMLLIVSGVGTLAYAVTQITEQIIEGGALQRRRREKRIARMKNHVIICGYGRIGRRIAEQFSHRNVEYVVIESDPAAIERLEREGRTYVDGDAREDDTLRRAGIHHAKSLVATLRSDSDNVYVVLSARGLNSGLHIVARAAYAETEHKLEQAGANRVISPYEIGGQYMATAVLRPHVVDFMDVVASTSNRQGISLEIEEIHIPEHCALAGTKLRDTTIRSERNIIVLAIRDASGASVYNPSPDHRIEAGGTLICIGTSEQLDGLVNEVRG